MLSDIGEFTAQIQDMHPLAGSVIMQHVDALEELSSVSDRSTPLGMILATVDFFLLGNLPTKLLMHTRGSSFASEAAMLHRHVKVVDVSTLVSLLREYCVQYI